ncbi:Phage-related baseplate assembly protein [compost metagenome]
MNNYADLARMIENLIRFGVIAEVQMNPPRVRVKTGELLTTWLPWIAVRAGTDKDWAPPTVDEQVVLFSPSGQLANGVATRHHFQFLASSISWLFERDEQ